MRGKGAKEATLCRGEEIEGKGGLGAKERRGECAEGLKGHRSCTIDGGGVTATFFSGLTWRQSSRFHTGVATGSRLLRK